MAGQFLDERIDLCARYGTSYEEGFVVSHIDDVGGSEYSRFYNPYPKLRYELNYQNGNRDGLAKRITNLYKNAGGTYRYFRVHHYAEFTTNNKTQPPTATDQLLIATPNDFGYFSYQLTTWYHFPSPAAPRRLITKPVPGTVKVAVGGVEPDSSLYYIDDQLGTVNFYSDPGGSVTAGCEFDIPMRFAADYSGVFNNLNVLSASVSLIEVLDASSTI
jgi:uncharacterized protein (TIGR02217 family)